MCTSAHYLNNIPLVVFTDTLGCIVKKYILKYEIYSNYNVFHIVLFP